MDANTDCTRFSRLESKITQLESRLFALESRTNPKESFFQTYLEQKFGASHCKNNFGATDIETNDSIIEIKNWSSYKSALGQILAYTHGKTKSKHVYFFGDKPKNIFDVLYLFKSYGINVFHLSVNERNEVKEEQVCEYEDEFMMWLDEHIVYKKDNVLQLSKVCELFVGNFVGTKTISSMKSRIEQFVSRKFPNLSHTYAKVRLGDKTMYGWKDICLTN